jgi:hypothetical protein
MLHALRYALVTCQVHGTAALKRQLAVLATGSKRLMLLAP